MATIDQQFVEYIVKTLVNNPDKVSVDRIIDEKGVLLSLTVDPEDIGRVIGKRGATAQSLRTLLRALGTKNDARYNLKIVNTDEEGGAKPAAKAEKPAETPVEETPAEEADDIVEDDTIEEAEESSALAEKTRAELADLDDLDI
ncbi:MAG: KH domain-containing protein [Candidatus Saccharibacteria bacterium]|nr:KH domain-containing protein [Candidatus Saccharibacteria bacterium]